ncbi:conjugal transfer protein [Vibrio ichthyoenteri ATCC 700023]|uniref:Conjugal transfer protein n=1 Tax=Vibrio ichthyoenteri ATCC 700023 TaxID=870968 RepID=F9S7I5_9VIBR|nr:type IV secretion system protein VirB10 [Vibrio ichthyoenteri]EGU31281.1 conjugal transfer protein [Vibrio ichthyoenteri ATCC 700023]
MSDNQGAITPIDAKPTKPKKTKKPKKDRGESTVGKNRGKKIDFVVLGMVAVCVVAVLGAFYFIIGGDKEEPTYDTTYAEVDEAIVVKEIGSDADSITNLMNKIAVQEAKEKAAAEALHLQQQEIIRQQKEEAERLRKAEEKRLREENDRLEKERDNPPKDDSPPDSSNNDSTLPTPQVDSSNASSQSNSDVPTPYERKLTSAVMPEIPSPPSSTPPSQNTTNNTLDSKNFVQGSASTKWRNKRDLLLVHGTNIACALRTEIISTYAGLVTCNVISDVYSANGKTLLVEKGSSVFGEQSITLEQGQARVFVTWSDIQTPEGVSIQIDSLGTGALGASGVDAWVDNHFKERFGGAILLAFIDDAFATIANHQADSKISTENSSDNVSDMASIALENSINIPPTGYVPIGTRLNILVARDIDMSSVYQLQSNE